MKEHSYYGYLKILLPLFGLVGLGQPESAQLRVLRRSNLFPPANIHFNVECHSFTRLPLIIFALQLHHIDIGNPTLSPRNDK